MLAPRGSVIDDGVISRSEFRQGLRGGLFSTGGSVVQVGKTKTSHAPKPVSGTGLDAAGLQIQKTWLPRVERVVEAPRIGTQVGTIYQEQTHVETITREVVKPVIEMKESVKEVPQILRHEKVEEVPSIRHADLVKQVPHVEYQSVTKAVSVPTYKVRNRTVEVPQVLYEELLVDVPQVQCVELIREVPKFKESVKKKRVPVPIVQVREKQVPVPQVIVKERITEVPKVQLVEMMRQVPKKELQQVERKVNVPSVRLETKDVEVPQVELHEKVVEVPETEICEVIKQKPVYVTKYRDIEVPKIQYKEIQKTVEVPHITYEERVVEVPQVEYREIVKHVPKTVKKYIDKKVPKHQMHYTKKTVEIEADPLIKEVAVEVPETREVELLVEVPRPQVVVEKKVIPKYYVQSEIKVEEVPIEIRHDKIVKVPEVQVVDRIKQVLNVVDEVVDKTVPKIELHEVEKTVEVPMMLIKEKIVEVPEVINIETFREELQPNLRSTWAGSLRSSNGGGVGATSGGLYTSFSGSLQAPLPTRGAPSGLGSHAALLPSTGIVFDGGSLRAPHPSAAWATTAATLVYPEGPIVTQPGADRPASLSESVGSVNTAPALAATTSPEPAVFPIEGPSHQPQGRIVHPSEVRPQSSTSAVGTAQFGSSFALGSTTSGSGTGGVGTGSVGISLPAPLLPAGSGLWPPSEPANSFAVGSSMSMEPTPHGGLGSGHVQPPSLAMNPPTTSMQLTTNSMAMGGFGSGLSWPSQPAAPAMRPSSGIAASGVPSNTASFVSGSFIPAPRNGDGQDSITGSFRGSVPFVNTPTGPGSMAMDAPFGSGPGQPPIPQQGSAPPELPSAVFSADSMGSPHSDFGVSAVSGGGASVGGLGGASVGGSASRPKSRWPFSNITSRAFGSKPFGSKESGTSSEHVHSILL